MIAEPSWMRLIGVGDVIDEKASVTEQNVAELLATFVERPVVAGQWPRDVCLGWILKLERRADEVFAFVRWAIEPALVATIQHGLAAVVVTSAPLGWVLTEAFPRSNPPQIQGELPCKTP